jgi:hypothetical protein
LEEQRAFQKSVLKIWSPESKSTWTRGRLIVHVDFGVRRGAPSAHLRQPAPRFGSLKCTRELRRTQRVSDLLEESRKRGYTRSAMTPMALCQLQGLSQGLWFKLVGFDEQA